MIWLVLLYAGQIAAQPAARTLIALNKDWYTMAQDSLMPSMEGFEKTDFLPTGWQTVQVPHNWDAYEGYRRKLHGNHHGYAWYRKSFPLLRKEPGKRYFLYFEGVGSYATVWLNGRQAGIHAGGRTSFTLDVTTVIKAGQANVLAVRADHPTGITDLPWVCGGCSPERGFSEGSQPMGIFRPVSLVITNDLRVQPFGVHAWNDTTVTTKQATIQLQTTIKNYDKYSRQVQVVQRLLNAAGKLVTQVATPALVQAGSELVLPQQLALQNNVHLWSLEDPYLYSIVTLIKEKGKVIDSVSMPYGIRWIRWSVVNSGSTNQFFLNGQPVFINGIAEYEHLLGNSHAFSEVQVRARALQMKAVGFNAFRDAHQPHNLRYQQYWDSLGILWWTQLSAHVWFDTPRFREQFKQLLKEWVIERRSCPSVVLWGLQNESKLPADFARECTELVRSLDPTASQQRLVTTCNGGEGTDWDVPQNWTGTYGGNPATYHEDVKRQVLIGEYGAWRTLDLHAEGGFVQNAPYSEDRMTLLMEQKIRLAESVKDSSSGHFFWLYTSHDNPGRVQGGEGLRELDRIGPVNYKGLLTPWEEPLDVFHMFRSNYASAPMVYIVSHTWPQRFTSPGKKDGLIVYSNCDEVELFNDVNHTSLGKRKRAGIGTHFQWDEVDIHYNVLYAVGYKNGKPVAQDQVILHNLPEAPHFKALIQDDPALLQPRAGYQYLYRVNAGGGDYKDSHGNTWLADRKLREPGTWGSGSWTDQFADMPAFFASQRQTYDPIKNTKDWPLFQTFRYGRDKLSYTFPVPDGEYLVELYFAEPWWGTGGGMDCTGYRLFDVAVNDQTVIHDLDIWKAVGHDAALRKTVAVKVTGGELVIHFPQVKVGQAILSAMAIGTKQKDIRPAPPSPALIGQLEGDTGYWQPRQWLNIGDVMYTDRSTAFTRLPSMLYGAEWLRTRGSRQPAAISSFKVPVTSDVYIAYPAGVATPSWMEGYEDMKTALDQQVLYRKRFTAGATVVLDKPSYSEELPMYGVFVNEASSIEPAYDLKPVASHKAAEGLLSGAAVKQVAVNGKEQVVFATDAEGVVDLKMTIGAADEYSVNFKYNWPGAQAITGELSLLQADGTLLKKEKVNLLNTRAGKWNYISTTTGSMINAGHYIIRFTTQAAKGLAVGGADVQ
ncbi:malectin domain-containing carbohydrate-binding protein [Paraflavitalea pollutisoli]|uniref:malectin domain-containing carbohydrate-binding protein n=1 Tax=Paraflavitalea pollutisoli TaxID=3034143 RepID=UPI0023EDB034|nr:malectin domain-containing carbohydrate-binding protein [Paraflavitalea sp. H1-2-19X]